MSAKTDSQRLHLHAEEIVVSARQQLQASRNHLAGYLGHVALECYLKAWILAGFGGNQAKLKSAHPDLYKKYFETSDGHDLNTLVGDMAIQRKFDASKARNPCQGAVWARMNHGKRPYSLRYREESDVALTKVEEELELTTAVMNRLGRLS